MLSLCKNTVLNNRIIKTAVSSVPMLQAPRIWIPCMNPLLYKSACFFTCLKSV